MAKKRYTTIGWREWVFLPRFSPLKINAKIDTGASTSAIHAEDISFFVRKGVKMVRFRVFPHQRSRDDGAWVEAEYLERRKVRSSVGHETLRPVVKTEITVGEQQFEIEITLVNREMMGFRMLIGRAALKGRFVVNPGVSYLESKALNRRPKKRRSR
ncbi:MAG TPA: ATP-dependent zinc protease [Bdellovibrionota bacterium]|jgi:hypothetical protein|nr:ATP-dependent zinc protease [Bdellovibrionota bacterium]